MSTLLHKVLSTADIFSKAPLSPINNDKSAATIQETEAFVIAMLSPMPATP